MNKIYPTDLTDSQWNHIKDFFPPPKQTGRPREIEFRQIVNAILFLLVTGCQWRMIPQDYGKWQSVYYYFAKWKKDGTWFRIHETLRAQERIRQGKNKHPTAGAADSQSVKTTAVPSARGFDAGKKINGRKRFAKSESGKQFATFYRKRRQSRLSGDVRFGRTRQSCDSFRYRRRGQTAQISEYVSRFGIDDFEQN